MLYIESLPAFKSQWVVRIDWKMRGRMILLVYSLGANTSVGKCSTLIHGPTIDVSMVVQLIEDFKPIVKIRVSPVRLDHGVPRLIGGLINIRFVRGHSLGP
jgi:hypothetical protein